MTTNNTARDRFLAEKVDPLDKISESSPGWVWKKCCFCAAGDVREYSATLGGKSRWKTCDVCEGIGYRPNWTAANVLRLWLKLCRHHDACVRNCIRRASDELTTWMQRSLRTPEESNARMLDIAAAALGYQESTTNKGANDE